MAEATESIEESENSLESLISAYLPSMFGIKPSSKPLKSFELDDIKITESLSILESLEAMEINSDGYYQCPQCLFKSKHCKATVRTHINTVHMGFRRFVCDYCGLGISSKQNLIYHFHTKHVARSRVKSVRVASNGFTKKCPYCDNVCQKMCNVRKHIIYHHFQKLQCEVPGCSFSVGSKSMLFRHFDRAHKKVAPALISQLKVKFRQMKVNFPQLRYDD